MLHLEGTWNVDVLARQRGEELARRAIAELLDSLLVAGRNREAAVCDCAKQKEDTTIGCMNFMVDACGGACLGGWCGSVTSPGGTPLARIFAESPRDLIIL